MNYVRKMMLVPEESLKNVQSKTNLFSTDHKVPVDNLQAEIANILDRDDIPIATRMTLYHQLMQRLLVKRNKLSNTPNPPAVPVTFTPTLPAAATPAASSLIFPHGFIAKPVPNYMPMPTLNLQNSPLLHDEAVIGAASPEVSFVGAQSSTPQKEIDEVYESDRQPSKEDLIFSMKVKMGEVIQKHFRLQHQTELVHKSTGEAIAESNFHDIINYIFTKSSRRFPVGTNEVVQAIYMEDFPVDFIINDKVKVAVQDLYEYEDQLAKRREKEERARAKLYKPKNQNPQSSLLPTTTRRPLTAAAVASQARRQQTGHGANKDIQWMKF